MDYIHARCGGAIENNQCSRCHKKWNFFSKWFATDIRLAKVQSRPVIGKGTTSYAPWADKVKGVNTFASHLPNIPRPWRIFWTILVLFVLVAVIFFIVRLIHG